MNNFNRISNKPIFFGSWVVALIGILVMGFAKPQGTLLYVCMGIFFVCFVLFGWQVLQASTSIWSDAERGAQIREQEEREQGRKP